MRCRTACRSPPVRLDVHGDGPVRARRPRRRPARGLRDTVAPRCKSRRRRGRGAERGSIDDDAHRRRPRRALRRARRRAPGAVVTIGVYDGVHLGHHAVLRLVRELADARDLAAVCVTFDRHPAEVVRPESAPSCSRRPSRSSSCSTPPATSTSRSSCTSTRPAARSRRRTSCARSSSMPRTPDSSWSAPTSTSARAGAATSRCCSAWARSSGFEVHRGRARGRAGGTGSGSSTPPPASASCSPRATSMAAAELLGQPLRGAGHRGRGRPPGPRARVPHRQRRGARPVLPPCRRDLRGHVRGPPMASSAWRRSRSAAVRRSTNRPTSSAARGVRARLRRRPLRASTWQCVRDRLRGELRSIPSTPWSRRSRKMSRTTRRCSRRSPVAAAHVRSWGDRGGQQRRDARRPRPARLPEGRRCHARWRRARRARGPRRARAATADGRSVARRDICSTPSRPTVPSTPSSC